MQFKVNGRNTSFLVCYDTLFARSDLRLLHETKHSLSKTFEIKNLLATSSLLGVNGSDYGPFLKDTISTVFLNLKVRSLIEQA